MLAMLLMLGCGTEVEGATEVGSAQAVKVYEVEYDCNELPESLSVPEALTRSTYAIELCDGGICRAAEGVTFDGTDLTFSSNCVVDGTLRIRWVNVD